MANRQNEDAALAYLKDFVTERHQHPTGNQPIMQALRQDPQAAAARARDNQLRPHAKLIAEKLEEFITPSKKAGNNKEKDTADKRLSRLSNVSKYRSDFLDPDKYQYFSNMITPPDGSGGYSEKIFRQNKELSEMVEEFVNEWPTRSTVNALTEKDTHALAGAKAEAEPEQLEAIDDDDDYSIDSDAWNEDTLAKLEEEALAEHRNKAPQAQGRKADNGVANSDRADLDRSPSPQSLGSGREPSQDGQRVSQIDSPSDARLFEPQASSHSGRPRETRRSRSAPAVLGTVADLHRESRDATRGPDDQRGSVIPDSQPSSPGDWLTVSFDGSPSPSPRGSREGSIGTQSSGDWLTVSSDGSPSPSQDAQRMSPIDSSSNAGSFGSWASSHYGRPGQSPDATRGPDDRRGSVIPDSQPSSPGDWRGGSAHSPIANPGGPSSSRSGRSDSSAPRDPSPSPAARSATPANRAPARDVTNLTGDDGPPPDVRGVKRPREVIDLNGDDAGRPADDAGRPAQRPRLDARARASYVR